MHPRMTSTETGPALDAGPDAKPTGDTAARRAVLNLHLGPGRRIGWQRPSRGSSLGSRRIDEDTFSD